MAKFPHASAAVALLVVGITAGTLTSCAESGDTSPSQVTPTSNATPTTQPATQPATQPGDVHDHADVDDAEMSQGEPDTTALVADFTLEPVVGDQPFTLSEARGQYVALHFLLKTECPVCIRHTQTYATRRDEIADVRQVFIKPDDMATIRQWTGKLGSDDARAALIYRDADATVAKQLDIPDGYKFHGEVVHYPAMVIVDPAGREVFRYVGTNNGDRYSFDQFKAKMAELRGE